VIAAFDVSAATISIRPLQRAHSRTPRRNTRQIRTAQGSRFGALGAASAGSRTLLWRGWLRQRYDPRSRRERRRADTEVAHEVGPRTRHDRDQALQRLVGRVHERRRPVAPGAQPEFDASIVQPRESVGGNRRAGEIAHHSLQALAIAGMDARGAACRLNPSTSAHSLYRFRGRGRRPASRSRPP
jgi:hypothetical protein